ncbi:hypothetical protein GCM10022243_00760 [Saccharothrix violaceirubra]|uniref:Uncharacterized protein n=1 Tax=Saccharothrix violaceirubra TaxID=413306 RepID=A0A7W7T2L9_9PSEU|nr:hypothetical protein [Saccharothrix violaceirubra]MBB4965429.1 hypothetical protein [Saccharothrix violaceirubra]
MAQCRESRVTGALYIAGNPGGLFYLRDGVVTGVRSPGSPGADTLVARGNVGNADTRALTATVLHDGAFAMVTGDIERYVIGGSAELPFVPASDGVTVDQLLAETTDRLDVVASLPVLVSPHRDRVVPARSAGPAELGAERQEIVAHATGRRTARDIAFAIGASLYPVTAEISRMLDEKLLETAPAAAAFNFVHGGLASLRPRADTVTDRRAEEVGVPPLPTRRPGRTRSGPAPG